MIIRLTSMGIRTLTVMFIVLLLMLGDFIFLRVGHTRPDEHFMVQINNLRVEHFFEPIVHNADVDLIASYINNGYDNFFSLLEFTESVGLGTDGRFPVYWRLHIESSVADQINKLSVHEQGFFVNPDASYWGHHIDYYTQEYVLVLIFENPLFRELQDSLKESITM